MGKLSIFKIIVIVVIFTVLADIGFSAVPQMPRMPSPTSPTSTAGSKNPRYQSKEEKLQQLRTESTTAAMEIDANYTKIIDYVNACQTPPKNELNGLQKSVLKNKKYLMVLNDSQKSVYHILSAWVYYFDQKNDKALKLAETGQKIFPQNLNAVKTRLALSLICKDYSAMIATLVETAGPNPARRIQPTTQTETEMPSMPGMEMPGVPSLNSTSSTATGELMLDVNAVRIELIGKTLDCNLSPLDSNLPSWESSGRLLCALLWKVDSAELNLFAPVAPKKIEPNEPNTQTPAIAQKQNIPAQPQQAQSQPSSGGPSPVIAPGAGAVSPANPNFLEDTGHPDSTPSAPQPQTTQPAVQEPVPSTEPMPIMPTMPMPISPGQQMPAEQTQPGTVHGQSLADIQTKPIPAFDDFAKLQAVFAKDKRTAFAAINFNDQTKKANIINWLKNNPKKCQIVFPAMEQSILSLVSEYLNEPILLIIAPDSTIRYAGKADGFLPQMIIDSILNSPEDTNKVDVNLPAVEYKQPVVEPEPNQKTAEQAVLPPVAQDSNNSQQGGQKIITVPETTKQDDDFFDPRAEDLIEHAKAFFKIGNRLQFHTYAKPIEMCRTVMKDYPNTKYATQAQVLLRQTPERFRERFNLTDQELGL
ncbi:MAG: hypothetical protein WC770_05820 [Phycisphaerae bacterium]